MRPASLDYVEQPVFTHDIVGLAHVRRHSGVPVAANQSAWGRHAILDIIRREAADVIMTDPHQEGGLMAMEKILGMCEAAGLAFVNHAFNVTTVNMTSHMHVMATSSACIPTLQGHPDYLADDYVTAPTDYSGGKMRISDRPGLGLEVDRDKVTAFHQAFLREGQAVSYASAAAGVIGTISRD